MNKRILIPGLLRDFACLSAADVMIAIFRSVLLSFLVFVPSAWAQEGQPVTPRIRVETTLFPVYDMAAAIGGERVVVSLLLPPGIEPHSYEPAPDDMARISGSDIFIYMGDAMEPWVSRLLPGITNQNLLIMDVSHGLELSGEGGMDPHVWLDFGKDRQIVDSIVDALADKDPEHRTEYLERGRAYQLLLSSLDERYRHALENCEYRSIIFAGHSVFGYLASAYGFQVRSAYGGFSPDAEPSPRALAGLIKELRSRQVKTVYYEELIDPKAARVISEESGAAMVLLSAAHNISADEKSAGVSFISIMENNLEKLKAGLVCR